MTDVPAGFPHGFTGGITWEQLAAFCAAVQASGTDFADAVITASTINSSVIGGTTPAAGTFTALSSTSGALNGSLGATTPGAVHATTLAASGVTAFSNASVSFTALPTSDPHVLGRAYTATGVVTISAG